METQTLNTLLKNPSVAWKRMLWFILFQNKKMTSRHRCQFFMKTSGMQNLWELISSHKTTAAFPTIRSRCYCSIQNTTTYEERLNESTNLYSGKTTFKQKPIWREKHCTSWQQKLHMMFQCPPLAQDSYQSKSVHWLKSWHRHVYTWHDDHISILLHLTKKVC